MKKSVQWTFDLVIDLGPTMVLDGAPVSISEKERRIERGLVVTGVRQENDWALTIQDEYEVQASAPASGGAGSQTGGNDGSGNSNTGSSGGSGSDDKL